ncbi:MAG: hypothetical protein LC664_06185, partial [Flavobacteriales bacterium]|nr:hypothetical protein [Flavobacteriales bacterium]
PARNVTCNLKLTNSRLTTPPLLRSHEPFRLLVVSAPSSLRVAHCPLQTNTTIAHCKPTHTSYHPKTSCKTNPLEEPYQLSTPSRAKTSANLLRIE